jgi:hypothetical protein
VLSRALDAANIQTVRVGMVELVIEMLKFMFLLFLVLLIPFAVI